MNDKLQWTHHAGNGVRMEKWTAVSNASDGSFGWVYCIIAKPSGTVWSYDMAGNLKSFPTFEEAEQWCNERDREYVQARERSEEIKVALDEAWRDE